MPPNFGINFDVNTCPQIFDEPTVPRATNLEARGNRRNIACVYLLCGDTYLFFFVFSFQSSSEQWLTTSVQGRKLQKPQILLCAFVSLFAAKVERE